MKKRKAGGTSDYNVPLTDEIKASIWTLTEEGRSQRAAADMLKLSPSAVGRELATDPIRLEALRARQREARAQNWKKVEDLGLTETIAWLETIQTYRLTPAKKLTKRQVEDLAALPRILQATRHAAESATKTVQLLTGGATERIERPGTESDQDLSAEQLIEMAIESDAIAILPPKLRAAAEREKARRESHDHPDAQPTRAPKPVPTRRAPGPNTHQAGARPPRRRAPKK